MGQPHSVGVVGLGVILDAYLATLADHPGVRIAAVADLDPDRARAVAERTGARAVAVAELMASDEVGTVLDLTTPGAHAEVALAAAAHGKNHYGEKPLAATLADAREVVGATTAAGTVLGCAPDTVLGTGIQTARAAVEAGRIGRPTAAVATWLSPGHEAWHPQPDFYYARGGGPVLDMGPYYLTSLVHLLGPVVAVSGAASRLRDTRTIATGPRAGAVIDVEVPTHVAGTLVHANGAISTVTVSFDAVGTHARPIEVHGEEGSLAIPDPNRFDGDVELLARGTRDWVTLEPSAGFVDASRGIGLLEMVEAAGLEAASSASSASSDTPRASGGVALHVMEIMTALLDSAETGRRIDLTTAPLVPPVVPLTPAERWRRG
ncbi:oxidoreductase [Serinibacter arcticus]|uniref:Oxidoreductase n=1 Tax=Serinibacter arcticus TaxID=1655435 RepID=A0A2U1ZWE6_9MICO|nr:Gfo/Idh/MocA family oxidoreductase [Serinibacter arcticus]PWD51294.1 oxidoreductase [Serinibacter arcticus]